jgi:hypothetical protein
MKQLIAFGECRYKPSCTNSEYIAWKRRQKREVSKYLDLIADTVPVIPDQLYLSSDFPGDPDAAESLLLDLGMTHVLSISSAQLPKPDLPLFNHFLLISQIMVARLCCSSFRQHVNLSAMPLPAEARCLFSAESSSELVS